MARFRDRVAIVTGAGAPGGIGAAVARALVAEGGRVVLGATSERVHQRAAELGGSAVGVQDGRVRLNSLDGPPSSVGRMSWDVDGVRITRVVEHVMPFPVDFFVEATPADGAAEAWLLPDFVTADGQYLMSLQAFVIEAGDLRIVVDTCTGNSKDRPLIPEFHQQDRPFLAQLTAAGFPPETIDLVVCTHLHVDHVGWNTRLVDGEWIPTFPRARYLFGAADIDSFAQSHDSLHAPAFADSVRPVIDAGLVDPVETDVALTGEVKLRSTPGHTPGHMSVWIGEHCVITGDVLHHPIQCRHPEWTARGDADPDAARATRRALLAAAAATNALVLGTHFAGTSAGRILSTDHGYRFIPQP